VRGVVGSKSLLFNQIAGGLSPRLSLTELEELGINVAIYSTPCLLTAHTAMANALIELRANDGRLREVTTDGVGVAASIALLERNLSGHHPRRRLDWTSEMRAAG
jgi:2-methylisocitrate lyase-like PEP mutase family enzyme